MYSSTSPYKVTLLCAEAAAEANSRAGRTDIFLFMSSLPWWFLFARAGRQFWRPALTLIALFLAALCLDGSLGQLRVGNALGPHPVVLRFFNRQRIAVAKVIHMDPVG